MRGNFPVTIRQRTLNGRGTPHRQLRDCDEPSRVHATCRQMMYRFLPESVQAFPAMKMLET